MYKNYQDKIADNYKDSFPLSWIVAENFLYLLIWFLAGFLLLPVQWYGLPVATILWAVIVVIIQVMLKKHNCSGCYYYGKFCHLGWGRLSSCLVKQDSGNIKTGMNLSLFYIISPPAILITAVIEGIFLQTGIWHWIVLGCYVILNIVSFPLRIKGCKLCAIRNVCPGSAIKSR